MDTKWKNTTDTQTNGSAPVPVRKKGLTLRAAAGLLSFLLGVLLLIESGFYFWAQLSSSKGRQDVRDCFQTDYQLTYAFRQDIAANLEVLLNMGAGGPLNFYGFNGGTPAQQAKRLHQLWAPDQNLLYSVSKNGEVLYTNRSGLTDKTTPSNFPKEYSFLLQFDGTKVSIWKNGQQLDIYKNGYYDFDNPDQWYVPGYRNFAAGPALADVRVTMAALDTPKVFIQGNYRSGSVQYNRLYYLQKEQADLRTQFYTQASILAVGVLLLVASRFLRQDKVRADRALARVTGKMWFEWKLLLLVLPLVSLFLVDAPTSSATVTLSDGVLDAASSSSAFTYETSSDVATILYGEPSFVYDVPETVLYSPPILLQQILDHPGAVMLLFLLWYVFGVNDWRYQKRPWSHGICGMLAARQLKRPIQKRLSRMAGLMGAAFMVLLLEFVCFYGMLCANIEFTPIFHVAALLPCAAALAVLVWSLLRQNRLWTDLGLLSDRLAAVRAGDLSHPVSLPEQHDLHQTMEDLNHIQQGIHQAVEERTQSERMKVELITNVSHDLKTPLTSIISYTELLEQEHLDPPAGEYVAILGQKAQRLKAMVQDVFEVSKASSGQLPVKLERLDLVRLLRQTLADQDEAIQDSGLVFRLSIPESPIYIRADSERLYRVFQNLISNALRYSLSGSRVYLTMEQQDGQVVTVLQNTSATELNAHTDYLARFVRGDESRTDGGSGLGLSIASSFTQVCGGVLDIRTQADLFTARVSFPVEM